MEASPYDKVNKGTKLITGSSASALRFLFYGGVRFQCGHVSKTRVGEPLPPCRCSKHRVGHLDIFGLDSSIGLAQPRFVFLQKRLPLRCRKPQLQLALFAEVPEHMP